MLNESEMTSLSVCRHCLKLPSFGQGTSADGLGTATLIARLTCPIVAGPGKLCSASWRWAGLDLPVTLPGSVTQRHRVFGLRLTISDLRGEFRTSTAACD